MIDTHTAEADCINQVLFHDPCAFRLIPANLALRKSEEEKQQQECKKV